jgi:hypothetical protein
MHRRTAIAYFGAFSTICLWGCLAPAKESPAQAGKDADKANPAKYALRSGRTAGAIDRVDVVLEVAGALKVAAAEDPEKGKTTSLAMSAEAMLTYDEKTLATAAAPGGTVGSVRHYHKAGATIRIADEYTKTALRDPQRLIGVQWRDNEISLFSPQGPLTREELDLIAPPGNTLAIDRLLPNDAVGVGDTWKNEPEAMAVLCGLESAGKCEVQSKLVEVVDNVARIEMAGRLDGLADGRKTEIELKAKCRFDLSTKRVTWLGLVLKENRKAGLIGPGLDVVARLQMKIVPGRSSTPLSDAALAGLKLEPTPELSQLEYASPGRGWRLHHDRNWIVINEKNEAVLLRRRLKEDFVVQCNISYVAKPPAGKPISLAIFQDDVRQSLGKNFGRFVRAGETTGPDESRIYRVAAHGEVQGVPIEWIYYLLTDAAGGRAVVVFTIESNTLEEFGDADQTLVQSLRFGENKVAARPKEPTGK